MKLLMALLLSLAIFSNAYNVSAQEVVPSDCVVEQQAPAEECPEEETPAEEAEPLVDEEQPEPEEKGELSNETVAGNEPVVENSQVLGAATEQEQENKDVLAETGMSPLATFLVGVVLITITVLGKKLARDEE